MPGAAAQPLAVLPRALLPPVLLEGPVPEHQLIQPRLEQLLDRLREEPPPDLPLRQQGVPHGHRILQLLERGIREPLLRLEEPPEHIQHPLRGRGRHAAVVVQEPIALLGLRVRRLRQHALAPVEAQHHLLVLLLPLVAIHIALAELPAARLLQDHRGDMRQLAHQVLGHPVEDLPPPRPPRGPAHRALFPKGLVALPRRSAIPLIRPRPIDVQGDQAPRELPRHHPEAAVARVGLVERLRIHPRATLVTPLAHVGGLPRHGNQSPLLGEHALLDPLKGRALLRKLLTGVSHVDSDAN